MTDDLEALQARYRRAVQRFGKQSEPARKAWIRLQAALHENLAAKPRIRVQANTERRV